MSAGYTVVLPIEDTDKAVYFNDADGFHLVLQKNELTGDGYDRKFPQNREPNRSISSNRTKEESL